MEVNQNINLWSSSKDLLVMQRFHSIDNTTTLAHLATEGTQLAVTGLEQVIICKTLLNQTNVDRIYLEIIHESKRYDEMETHKVVFYN